MTLPSNELFALLMQTKLTVTLREEANAAATVVEQ
jgi:hypothetical protein